MANEYKIETVQDFLKIPLDKIDLCIDEFKDGLKHAKELEAILLLEYHNKNHLSAGCNPKKLNQDKRSIVLSIKTIANGDRGQQG